MNATFDWVSGKIIPDLPATQVYGYCLTSTGEVILTRDKDETRYTLPGGRVELNESPEEAMRRELQEEAQVEATTVQLLGVVEVVDPAGNTPAEKHHQQVRYVCTVESMGDFMPEKDGWETVERITVAPADLPKYLEWIQYPSGKSQYQEFLAIISK